MEHGKNYFDFASNEPVVINANVLQNTRYDQNSSLTNWQRSIVVRMLISAGKLSVILCQTARLTGDHFVVKPSRIRYQSANMANSTIHPSEVSK